MPTNAPLSPTDAPVGGPVSAPTFKPVPDPTIKPTTGGESSSSVHYSMVCFIDVVLVSVAVQLI